MNITETMPRNLRCKLEGEMKHKAIQDIGDMMVENNGKVDLRPLFKVMSALMSIEGPVFLDIEEGKTISDAIVSPCGIHRVV